MNNIIKKKKCNLDYWISKFFI